MKIKWIVVLVFAGVIFLSSAMGKRPFSELNANEIESITLLCIPPEVEVLIEDRETIGRIADILQTVITYRKDNSGSNYSGQLVQYTLLMSSGETTVVGAYNPFVFIDGKGYKTKYEPVEKLNSLGNQLRGDKKSPYQMAMDMINAYYPEALEIVSTGRETIVLAEASVEVFTFEVVVTGGRETCAVSQDGEMFFVYSSGEWQEL